MKIEIELDAHVVRMIDERNELEERLGKLNHYIQANYIQNSYLPPAAEEAKSLMERQLSRMRGYLEILEERINHSMKEQICESVKNSGNAL